MPFTPCPDKACLHGGNDVLVLAKNGLELFNMPENNWQRSIRLANLCRVGESRNALQSGSADCRKIIADVLQSLQRKVAGAPLLQSKISEQQRARLAECCKLCDIEFLVRGNLPHGHPCYFNLVKSAFGIEDDLVRGGKENVFCLRDEILV